MKPLHILRSCLLTAMTVSFSVAVAEPGDTLTLSLPPDSLAQWYKPASKRQVWLHTMFRLRRSMRAVALYANREDGDRLGKWMQRLSDDYRKIGDMVPEWEERLDMQALESLRDAAQRMDKDAILRARHELKKSCRDCHDEYRAVTALIHRSPDFSAVSMLDDEGIGEIDFNDAMDALSDSINDIVIALDDDRPGDARAAGNTLLRQLQTLSGTCSSCHRDDSARNRILGEKQKQDMAELDRLIRSGDMRQSKRAVGHIAVDVCARCHGIHRTVQDLRQFLSSRQVDER